MRLNQATFDQLINNSAATLGAGLLDKQTIAVKPNTNQQLSIALASQTLYVGVVAAYRNINHAPLGIKLSGSSPIKTILLILISNHKA